MYKIAKLFVMLAVISSVSYPHAATAVQNVSFLKLLIQPDTFDGKTIAVVGFLDVSSDGCLLFLHREDSENWILEDAVWVHRNEQMNKDQGFLNHKYVKLIGKFKRGYTQQLGDPPNGFSEVQETRLWSDPASPVGRKKIPGVNTAP